MINIKLEYIINSIGLLGALLISYKTYNYTKCNMHDSDVSLKNNIKNLTVEIEDILPNDTLDIMEVPDDSNDSDDSNAPPDITEVPDDSNDPNDNPIIMMASI